MPAEPVLVRPATVDDADAIAATYHDAARAAWRHIVPPAALDAQTPDPAQWVDRLQSLDAGDVVLVAEVDGDVVGFVWVRPHSAAPDTGEVAMLYSRPGVWGRGVGRALLDAGLEHCRSAGCTEATLWTEARNHRPRRVYEAYGFRFDGAVQERSYLGAPIREVRYRLTL